MCWFCFQYVTSFFFSRCWARWDPDYLIWFCLHVKAYVPLWNYDPCSWKPSGCMITILQFSIWFCRMLLWYSPPPHPKSHHSADFFFTQSIISAELNIPGWEWQVGWCTHLCWGKPTLNMLKLENCVSIYHMHF